MTEWNVRTVEDKKEKCRERLTIKEGNAEKDCGQRKNETSKIEWKANEKRREGAEIV